MAGNGTGRGRVGPRRINESSRSRKRSASARPVAGRPLNLESNVLKDAAALESRLGEMERQLQHLQRLASLGTMSAVLAHEINNLLTPLVGYCQYAQAHPEPQILRKTVDKAHAAAKRLQALCLRVMGMASEEPERAEAINLRGLVMEVIEGFGRDLSRDRIALSIQIPDDWTACLPAGALHQVLFNLLLNARQAMAGQPGELRIAAARRDDGGIDLSVGDTGPGIAPENLGRLFEPFFTTKGGAKTIDRGGLGLGLAVCRRILHGLGGEIAAANEPGRGALFTISLPAGASRSG